MDNRKTTIERAFELARSGKFHNVAELRRRLAEEQYATFQVMGPILCRQLKSVIGVARS